MSSSDHSKDENLSPPRKKTKPSNQEEDVDFDYLIAHSNASDLLKADKGVFKEWIIENQDKFGKIVASEKNPEMMNVLVDAADLYLLDWLFVADENEKSIDDEEEYEIDYSTNRLIDKRTTLCMACELGNGEMVKLLLSKGVKIDLGTTTPLFVACEKGDLEIVELLLSESKKFDISKGRLEESVGEDHAEFESCFSGVTPLFIACLNGFVDIVKLLLSKQEIEINLGYITPLYGACMNGHEEIVKLLLENSKIKVNKGKHTYSGYWDGYGYTKVNNEKPITIAESKKFDNIVALLKQVKITNDSDEENDENEEEEENEE
ncbi:predicted protein [Naegleria gruberi]|uniref:Predicted protein n=1 Tax=Naegleria gruberi TaxID=5762 RepID=D2VEH7_NAEGR|nr:uncharacterized protein NAEGRDRAFT_48899 [Naegleria gruberi]EFC44881.1 predicted protein [Naegleria gruberi]|eukprot:XP_002677625.1 predicted protein [Naegleria gruberi strain NEG-M]